MFDISLDAAKPWFDNVTATFSPEVADGILINAGNKVGVAAEALISPYPPASGNPLPIYYTRTRKDGTTFQSKFKSIAQQRKVMALVAQGKVPYRRTGQLGRSITSQAFLSGSGFVIVRVGSNLSYAAFVLDRLMQSHYHMNTWTPIQNDIQQGLPGLMHIAVSSVVNDVKERLNNG